MWFIRIIATLPNPDQAWKHISMDFIEQLPKSAGKDTILAVICRFTKHSHFLTLSHPFSATTVAKLFMDSIFKLHRAPLTIVSDRDKLFTSLFWKKFFKLLGVKSCYNSADHPQSDGQAKRLNQYIEGYLRCFAYLKPTN